MRFIESWQTVCILWRFSEKYYSWKGQPTWFCVDLMRGQSVGLEETIIISSLLSCSEFTHILGPELTCHCSLTSLIFIILMGALVQVLSSFVGMFIEIYIHYIICYSLSLFIVEILEASIRSTFSRKLFIRFFWNLIWS